jgi:hypothetical protein
MPIDVHPKRKGPTSDEVVAEQKRQAAVLAEQKRQAAAKTNVPAKVTPASTPAPAIIDNRIPEQRYIDDIAPSVIAGQLVKFSKEGKFIVSETEEEISPDTDFVALCDETLIGWIKFRDDDEPPDRVQGLLYDGFCIAVPRQPWRSRSKPMAARLIRPARGPVAASSLFGAAKSRDAGVLHLRHHQPDRQTCLRKSVAALRPHATARPG